MSRVTSTAVWLAGVSALAVSSLVHAQEAELALEEIVVTGSRVIKNGDASPTPVTVINTEDMGRVQPTTLADQMQLVPVFSGSRGQFSNPSATGGVGGGNGVASQLNLRNVGSLRNLVLFDGKRLQPTSITGIVDLDMIPQMLVQRADTVTGGVSAVYGSDAVTGVINFITNRNFNGIGVNAQYGVSGHDDGQAYNVGVVFGTDLFDGRGHFEGSYEYRDDKGILYRSARSWSNQWMIGGNGSATNPYRLVENGRVSNQSFGGLITSGYYNGQDFASNGVLTPFVNGTSAGVANRQVGGNGVFNDSSMKAPLESHQVFGRFDFDITDGLHWYVVAAGNFKKNEFFADATSLSNVVISANNAFLSPTYRDQLAALTPAQTTFTLGKYISDARFNGKPESDQSWFNTGLEGNLGDYAWNLSLTRGMTTLRSTLSNNVNEERLRAALDAVTNSSGQIVCYSALTGARPDCVPLNVFGPTSESQAALDYVLGDVSYVGKTTMDDVAADISGAPFTTWAGEVNMALSAEWRRLQYRATSDGTPSNFANCTDIRFNSCNASTILWRQTFPNFPKVKQSVKEVAYEVDVPLLVNVPAVASFNLNGAVRYTSYDTSGDYTTWKAGLDWHITDELRIRGTKSRDIRAPTLNDLYAPESVVQVQNIDLLVAGNPSPNVASINRGNPNLTAEIGDTVTAGIVWKPSFLPGFSAALDVYRIVISDAIQTTQGWTDVLQRTCYDSGGTSSYCSLQVRPINYTDTTAANTVSAWYVVPFNIAEIETKGVDLELNYATDLFGRAFSVRTLAAYQPHIYFDQPGAATLDQAGVAFGPTGMTAAPKWRVTGLISYKVTDNISVDVSERWRSSLKFTSDVAGVYWVKNRIPSWATTNLNVGYELPMEDSKLGLFLNIQNLFDKDPPGAQALNTVPGNFGGWAGSDDPTGRYFTVGVRYRH